MKKIPILKSILGILLTLAVVGAMLVAAVPVGATALTITSFSPTSGGTNTAVVITGSGFTGALAVSIGGTAATRYTVNSDSQITAYVGSGTTGTISVTPSSGSAVNSAASFTFTSTTTYVNIIDGPNSYPITTSAWSALEATTGDYQAVTGYWGSSNYYTYFGVPIYVLMNQIPGFSLTGYSVVIQDNETPPYQVLVGPAWQGSYHR